MHSTDIRVARLVSCDLVARRFAGRAPLRRVAEHDDVALVRLEHALGLASIDDVVAAVRAARLDALRSAPAAARAAPVPSVADIEARGCPWAEAQAARLYARSEDLAQRAAAARIAPALCAAIDRTRAQRHAARAAADELAARRPGHAADVIARRRAKEAIDLAGFRRAYHQHTRIIRGVALEHEGATSTTGSVRPRDVGLPAAYAERAAFVATSRHEWRVSAAILAPHVRVLNAQAPRGIVYLSIAVRVRQGRGTALVLEQRAGARGGWQVKP